MKIRGFTLAEVLITLVIIGAVASLTIPDLINNINDTQYRIGLKKNYSTLTQVYNRIVADNGSITNALSGCTNQDCFKNILKTYLNYTKECNSGTVSNNCFSSTIKDLSGSSASDGAFLALSYTAGLILSDGTLLITRLDRTDCSQSRGTAYSDECGWINVDVNGLTGPNTWGKDIYNFRFTSNSVKPAGVQNDDMYNTCTSTASGIGCAAVYLSQ